MGLDGEGGDIFPSLFPGREKRTQSDEDLSVRAALPHPVRIPCSVCRGSADEDGEEEQEKYAGLFIHAEGIMRGNRTIEWGSVRLVGWLRALWWVGVSVLAHTQTALFARHDKLCATNQSSLARKRRGDVFACLFAVCSLYFAVATAILRGMDRDSSGFGIGWVGFWMDGWVGYTVAFFFSLRLVCGLGTSR